MKTPASFLQLRSEIKKRGTLELSLAEVPMPEPAENEVLVRVEASPINPSDLGLLFGAADMSYNASGAPRQTRVDTDRGSNPSPHSRPHPDELGGLTASAS